VPIGHLGEAGVEETNDTPRDGSEQFRPVEAGLEVLESAITTAELAQVGSGGDTEQASGVKDGSVGQAVSGSVLEISDAQVDGNGSIGGHTAG
jgi:hypothetical protein